MPNTERQPNQTSKDLPLRPFELPPELANFLKDKTYACLTQATDKGTVLVVKAPARDIESLRGNVPIQLREELYDHPRAPVIRILVRIYDQPNRPLALETFVNVADPQQRADFVALANQEELHLLFYDESLSHRLTKGVRNFSKDAITLALSNADRLLARIPPDRFDFDKAKEDVMRTTDV